MPLSIRIRTLPVRLLLWIVWKCFGGATYVEQSYWKLAHDLYTASIDKALQERETKVREFMVSPLPLRVTRTTIILTNDVVTTLRARAVHAFDFLPHLQARFDERLRAEPTIRNVWP